MPGDPLPYESKDPKRPAPTPWWVPVAFLVTVVLWFASVGNAFVTVARATPAINRRIGLEGLALSMVAASACIVIARRRPRSPWTIAALLLFSLSLFVAYVNVRRAAYGLW